jgi:hypothetical protein
MLPGDPHNETTATMMTDTFNPDFASPAEYAKFYRSLGLQVVPAHEPRQGFSWKRPVIKWREYENELVSDATFGEWYGERGQHITRTNMGILTGPASGGVFVIDIDSHSHADAALWWECIRDFERTAGELDTVTQTTGGNGKQMLFRSPAGWSSPTCRTPIGVDIRGIGGFAVVAPSMHTSGRNYSWDPGLAPWEVDIAEAPLWLCEEIDKLAQMYGAGRNLEENEGGSAVGQIVRTATPKAALNPFGLIEDGREAYMARVVWAAVVDEYRECPIKPAGDDARQIMRKAFEAYERNTKSRIREPGTPNHILLERENRGITLFRQKWDAAMRQWEGKVAKHAAMEVVRERPQPIALRQGGQTSETTASTGLAQNLSESEDGFAPVHTHLLQLLDVREIKALPDPKYLIQGIVIDESLGFIFGPPGCGKSFIAMNMALSIATKQPTWWEREIVKTGPVLYISSEGVSDMKYRIRAWERSHGILVDDAPFYLLRQGLNFMAETDVALLLKTVEALSRRVGQSPVCIFVDTVSRVLPGADENLQKDMTLFIKACDALRESFGATVIGVHHTSRAGGAMRGSSVFDGAGDCLLQIEREEGSMEGVMTARKIKSAPDGWKQDFRLETVHTGDIMGTMSLYARGINFPAEEGEAPEEKGFGGRDERNVVAGMKWPEKPICTAILVAMKQAWERDEGWSTAVQTKMSGRYAYGIIARDYSVGLTTAKMMLETWAINGVIREDVFDKSSKKRGLRVLFIPD